MTRPRPPSEPLSEGKPAVDRPAPARGWRGLRGSLLPCLLLFALAAYLRLDGLWLVEFKRDEAVLADRALSFAEGVAVPLSGNPSGAGVLNPPGFVYLMSLPLRVWPHPIAGSAFLAILGALAVVALYHLGRRHFGPTAGLAAALLYAVNPWAIWFTRHIWEPDSVQLFVVLYFLALYGFVVDGDRRALGLSVVALAFLTQLHFSTVTLAPALALGILLGRRHVSWRGLGLGGLAALLMYAPYLYGDATHGWPSLRALLALPAGEARVDAAALSLARELISGFSFFLPDDLAGSSAPARLGLWLLRHGELALTIVGLIAAGGLALRGSPRRRAAAWLLLVWLAAPVLLSTRHWLNLHVHYYLTLLPALTLACGVGLSAAGRATTWALGRVRAPARWASLLGSAVIGLATLAVACPQVHAGRSLAAEVAAGHRARYNYGVPIAYTSALADYLQSAGYDRVRVISDSEDLVEAIDTLLRGRVATRRFDSRTALPLPPPEGEVYVVLEDDSPAARLLASTAERWRVKQLEEQGRPVYTVYDLPGEFAASLKATGYTPLDRRFEHGLRLLGAKVPRAVPAGQPVEVATLWQVESRPPLGPDSYVAFAHLLDSDRRQVAAAQEYGHLPSISDLGGEWVGFTRLAAPADLRFGAAWLEYGLFRWPSGQSVDTLDSEGRPAGAQVLLGPIKGVPATRPAADSPEHPVRAVFADGITLRGYDLERRAPEELAVTLHWLARSTPSRDYQAFVHLIDEAGRLVAQQDAPPGELPTTLWDEGDALASRHVVPLPAALPAGRYEVRVGLYLLSDGRRLPVEEYSGAVVDDAVALAAVDQP